MKTEKILSNVLEKVSLSKEETKRIEKETYELVKILKKNKLNANIGGSLAKGTVLKKDNQDVDIFIMLKPEEISKFEKFVAKTKLNYSIVHGSRDYIQIKKEDLTFELIPVLKLDKKNKIENVTDFSLVHVQYIKRKIKKQPKLTDEIKLAKAFCHANKCYGAESYIGGFSGYSLEVLVSYYGSFLKFLKKIPTEKIIDPEKQFKNNNEILRELNQSKLQSPLILIDPTYKYRNVCAGLTKETFELFVQKAKEFLKNPTEDLFQKKEFSLDNFLIYAHNQNLEVYQIKIKTNRQSGDIAGTKMKKLFNFLIRELERKEQNVISSEFIYSGGQESEGYLAIKKKEFIEIQGPRKNMEKSVEQFKKVRKIVYIKNGYVCAKERVSIPDIFIRNNYTAESMGTGFEFKKL